MAKKKIAKVVKSEKDSNSIKLSEIQAFISNLIEDVISAVEDDSEFDLGGKEISALDALKVLNYIEQNIEEILSDKS